MNAPDDPPAMADLQPTVGAPPARRPGASLPVTDGSTSDGRNGDGVFEAENTWQAALWRRVRVRPGRAVVAGIVVGLMFGLLAGELLVRGPTKWTSETVTVFDDPLGIALAGDPSELAKLGALRYKYASLVATEALAGPVAATLHVPVSAVLASASVVVPVNSVLLDVVGTWDSPGFARDVSNAMAKEIISYVHAEDVTYNIPASDRFSVTIVSPTSQPVASGPSKTRAIGVGVIVFIGAFLLGFCAHQLVVAPTRRRSP